LRTVSREECRFDSQAEEEAEEEEEEEAGSDVPVACVPLFASALIFASLAAMGNATTGATGWATGGDTMEATTGGIGAGGRD
jgi:hypothetical protein